MCARETQWKYHKINLGTLKDNYERHSYDRIRAGAGSRPASGCITCQRTLHIFLIAQSDPNIFDAASMYTYLCMCMLFFRFFNNRNKNEEKQPNNRKHWQAALETLEDVKQSKKKTDEKIKINKKFAVASGTLCRPVPFRFNPIRSGTIPLDFFDPLRRVDSVRGTLLPFGRQFLAAWPLLVRDHKRKNAHAFASPTQKTLRKWPQRWLGQVRQCCCCCRWPNSLRQISVNVSSASSLSLARLLSSLTLCVSFSVWLSIYLSLCLSPSM